MWNIIGNANNEKMEKTNSDTNMRRAQFFLLYVQIEATSVATDNSQSLMNRIQALAKRGAIILNGESVE